LLRTFPEGALRRASSVVEQGFPCESDALKAFNLMGKVLEKNGLTNAVSSGGERIDFSIIGTVKIKKPVPMPEKKP
jgi:hypothetical protein